VEAEVINKKQHNEYFWKGLPCNLRYAIGDCLEARDADFESNQIPVVKRAMEARRFVLRKAATRGGWEQMSKKEKKWKKGELSGEKSEDKMIGIKTGSESDSENEKKVVKRSEKREVRTRKVQFEEEGRKSKDV